MWRQFLVREDFFINLTVKSCSRTDWNVYAAGVKIRLNTKYFQQMTTNIGAHSVKACILSIFNTY
jgi:hypothetical protein